MTAALGPVLVPISKRLVLVNSLSAVATRLLTVGAFAWVIQYLMKRIPDEELALLPVVLSFALALPLLQTILTGGLSRYVTEAYARNDLAGVTRIVSSQFPILLVAGLAILLIGGLAAWNVDHILTVPPTLIGEARFMSLLVIGRLAIAMPLVPFHTGLIAQQRFVLQNVIDIAASLVRIVLMLVLILGIGPEVQWVIVAQIASQLFAIVLRTGFSVWLLPALRYVPASFDWGSCRQILGFGGWSFVSEAAYLIRRAADVPILYELATPLAVNDFFLGSLFETQLRELTIRAMEPLMPPLTAMHAHQQTARLASAFLRGTRVLLWAAMIVVVPLMVFSYDLFSLYLGRDYPAHADAATVMIILLLVCPVTYPMVTYYRIAFAQGKIRPVALRTLATQLANLALTLFLVGTLKMGAIGSAISTLVTFTIAQPLFFWPLAIRTLNSSWRKFFSEALLPGITPSVVAGCSGLLAAQWLPDLSLLRVAVGVPVCFVTYSIAVSLLLKPADRADLARIRQSVRV